MSAMMGLKQIAIWMSRMAHSRGFGIQSPTDYAFVRYVINEHWPYYQYDSLPTANWETLHLARLYFRLSNWRQPSVIVVPNPMDDNDLRTTYLKAGCYKATLQSESPTIELMLQPLVGNYRQQLLDSLNRVDDQSVVIVEHLYEDWAFWHSLVADPRAIITFDLYYCGIILFDKKRTKQHYKINF